MTGSFVYCYLLDGLRIVHVYVGVGTYLPSSCT